MSDERAEAVTERDAWMRSDGDRRGAEGSPVTRRVLLAASGAVLLTSAAAGAAGARARAGTQPRPAAGDAASRTGARAGPGQARPGTSASARHLELARHEAPPRHAQPRLPYGEPMYTIADGPKVVALTIDDGPAEPGIHAAGPPDPAPVRGYRVVLDDRGKRGHVP